MTSTPTRGDALLALAREVEIAVAGGGYEDDENGVAMFAASQEWAQNMVESLRALAAPAAGAHPDALPNGMLSKSTAKRPAAVGAAAQGEVGNATLQATAAASAMDVWEARYRNLLTLIDAAAADEDGMSGVAFSAQAPMYLLDWKSESQIADMLCTNALPLTTPPAEQVQGEAAGEVYALPTGEHRVHLAKHARDLPVGTKLYTAPPAAKEQVEAVEGGPDRTARLLQGALDDVEKAIGVLVVLHEGSAEECECDGRTELAVVHREAVNLLHYARDLHRANVADESALAQPRAERQEGE